MTVWMRLSTAAHRAVVAEVLEVGVAGQVGLLDRAGRGRRAAAARGDRTAH
jgi:hypothetical protein